MKRFLSGALVLLAASAAAFFFVQARRTQPERSRATELAPAETVFFAHLPNLRESVLRFRQTGLFAIWQEPEMQAFLEKPRQKAPQVRQWEQKAALLARVAPGEAFLALTSIDGPQPRFIAGFSFGGSRAEVEALLAGSRAEFQQRWPAGKSAVVTHRGAVIKTFRYAKGEIGECIAGRWCFLSNDVALLRGTLDRAESPAGAHQGTLASHATFQKAIAPLGGGSDFLLFGQFATLGGRLGSLLTPSGQPAPAKQSPELQKVQAIAAATRIDGRQMRDTVFVLSPGAAGEELLARNTLALSGPQTFLYYATGIAPLLRVPEQAGPFAALLPGWAPLERALVEEGLVWSDFDAAFGPEIGITLEWPAEAAMPGLLLALEVRDAEKARAFVETLTRGKRGTPAWTRREEGAVVFFSAPEPGLALTRPTLALTPRFAVLGFTPEGVTAGLQRIAAPAAGLAASPAYQQATRMIAPPTAGFGYLDAAALFERAYRMLRPVITMSLAFSEETGSYIDAGRMPAAETISKHLTPSVFSQSAVEGGALFESTGTLTFNQVLIGAVGSAVAAALPGVKTSLERDVGAAPIQPSQPASGAPSRPVAHEVPGLAEHGDPRSGRASAEDSAASAGALPGPLAAPVAISERP